MKMNALSSNAQTKQRLINILEIDKKQQDAEIIKEPMQPYMEFIMDVSALSIKHHTSEPVFSVSNKAAGLKFQIKQLEQDYLHRDRYEIKLFNQNELRFSAKILNASLVAPNQWYYTTKYEDTVSKDDVKGFIEVASLLYGKSQTEQIVNETDLVQLTMLLVKPGNRKFKYDDNISLVCNWPLPVGDERPEIRVELVTKNITLAKYSFHKDEDDNFILDSQEILHNLPEPVLNSLADIIRNDAARFLSTKSEQETIKRQEAFYQSNQGQYYEEQAQLSDIFRSYAVGE